MLDDSRVRWVKLVKLVRKVKCVKIISGSEGLNDLMLQCWSDVSEGSVWSDGSYLSDGSDGSEGSDGPYGSEWSVMLGYWFYVSLINSSAKIFAKLKLQDGLMGWRTERNDGLLFQRFD